MAKKTLADAFGSGASQDGTSVAIQKASLTTVGLTNQATIAAQSLVVALTKLWANVFTTVNRTNNPDETLTVTWDGFSTRTENGVQYRVDTWRVQAFKPIPSSDADPDDY